MPRYTFEATRGIAGRYRDTQTGRFVASNIVRKELDVYLAANDNAARTLAQMLRNKQVGLSDWELAMRRIIKNTHLNSIALERGGWANMRPQDYGRAGSIIRKQYEYLRGFAFDIIDGKQRRDGTLDWRAQLYGQAGRNSFYQSKHANMDSRINRVGSVRNATDSCTECVDLDGKWFALDDPEYKLPGDRICLTNCHCTERYGVIGDDGIEDLGQA